MNTARPPAPGTAPQADWAVCAARFQPPHAGHLRRLAEALALARQVVVVIAGAHHARTPRDPWGWQDIADLLLAALPERDRARLRFLPQRELADPTAWTQAVAAGVARLSGSAPGTPWPQVGAAGARATEPGSLPECPALPGALWHDLPEAGPDDRPALRDTLFRLDSATRALQALAPELPAPVLASLRDWAARPPTHQPDQPDYTALRAEWRALRQQREAWAAAPYPPVFVTVDAVVQCAGHVLLIRRGRAPGVGLLALPGGFLEPDDTVQQSALREVAEETGLGLPESAWRAALRGVAVFDAPARSQRGRTVTHAHHFDLGPGPLPPVQGGDDAREAHWLPIDALAGLEAQFFDDHYLVLDRFLGLIEGDTAPT